MPFKVWFYFWFHFGPEVPNTTDTEFVPIPVLLPHEVLHCLSEAGPAQAGGVSFLPGCFLKLLIAGFWKPEYLNCEQMARSMTGSFTPEDLEHFWQLCMEHEDWKNHPALTASDVDLKRCSATMLFLYVQSRLEFQKGFCCAVVKLDSRLHPCLLSLRWCGVLR